MGKRDYFKLGAYNTICYVCGFKRKSSEMHKRWDGVWVCKEDWEIRQPQDFVRGEPEETVLEWSQPEPPDTFVASYTPLTNIVVGTPSIYLNGALLVSGVDYTIALPQGAITFTIAPPQGSIIAWSGTWLDNARVSTTYTQFPLYTASGFNSFYVIYGAN